MRKSTDLPASLVQTELVPAWSTSRPWPPVNKEFSGLRSQGGEKRGWGRERKLRASVVITGSCDRIQNLLFSESSKKMPPKRRLSATSGGDDGDEDSKEQVQEPGRKKKKMDPGQQMQVV